MKRDQFDRGAWLYLILMFVWLTFAVGTTFYRFTRPTDGWLTTTPLDYNSSGYVYRKNILGIVSELQPGDYLVAVNGIAISEKVPAPTWIVKKDWQAGNSVQYTIRRGEQELQIEVPLGRWDFWRFLTGSLNPANLTMWLSFAVFQVMGFISFWRRSLEPAARALWILSSVWFAICTSIGILPETVSDDVFPLAGLSLAALIVATFTILAPPAFIRFALVFPRPKPILLKHPWIAYIPYGVGVIGLGAFALQFFVFGFVWTGLSVLIALIILIHNVVTMRDAVSRAQLHWGLGGMIAGLGMFFVMYIPVFTGLRGPVVEILNAIGPLGFGLMGIALGMSVLRYRLWDIDFIIRRTLSYAILTALLSLVYFGSVAILQVLVSAVGGQQSAVATVTSTLAIAALFTPLRRRVQDFIDRRFYRQKYDAEKALSQFAAVARTEADLEVLSNQMFQVACESLKPEFARIWFVKKKDD